MSLAIVRAGLSGSLQSHVARQMTKRLDAESRVSPPADRAVCRYVRQIGQGFLQKHILRRRVWVQFASADRLAVVYNMSKEAPLSAVEREFIIEALRQDVRLDGRRPDQYRPVSLSFGAEYGHVKVQLGNTRYCVFVRWGLTLPGRWTANGDEQVSLCASLPRSPSRARTVRLTASLP